VVLMPANYVTHLSQHLGELNLAFSIIVFHLFSPPTTASV
jgi:hypothetical protein